MWYNGGMARDDETKTQDTPKQEWLDFDAGLKAEGIHVQDYAGEEKTLREEHPGETSVIETSGAVQRQIIETVKTKEALGRDGLTGAMTRAKMEAEMKKLQADASRNHGVRKSDTARESQHSPFSFIMVDVDHFKNVNDTFGHPVGDVVLCEIVRRIQSRVRAGDMVARWGGEEFAVVALSANGSAAVLAEDLRQLIEKEPIKFIDEHGKNQSIQVTASFGIAPYDENIDTFVGHADRALYSAKRGGRNRVYAIDEGTGRPGLYIPEGSRIPPRPARTTASPPPSLS